jgi:hypothetical protein
MGGGGNLSSGGGSRDGRGRSEDENWIAMLM